MARSKAFLLPVISLLFGTMLFAAGSSLEWDPSTSPQIAGYWLYYGETSRQYTQILDVGNVTSCAVPSLPPGPWYFAVKAYDSLGDESPFSNEVTMTVPGYPNAGPPAISGITISNVTGQGATISWATDKLSDSEVEYWVTPGDIRRAALRDLTAAHSLVLNGLDTSGAYHIVVKSTGPEGSQAVGPEIVFTTAQSLVPALAWPRPAAANGVLGAKIRAGVALVNLGDMPATLTLNAMEAGGSLTAGPGISNPIERQLPPRSQIAVIDWQLFGAGLSALNSNGWIRLETGMDEVDGLFELFDDDLSLLDGAILSGSPVTDFVFAEIEPNGYNSISLINGNPEDAAVKIDLMRGDGSVYGSRSQVVKSNGVLTADLFNDLFKQFQRGADQYIRVRSTQRLQSFQVMKQGSGDISMLSGQDAAAWNSALYSPQYAEGGDYRTALSVINLDSAGGTVTFRLIGGDGSQIGESRAVAIAPNGKLYIDDPAFFRPADSSVMTAGYVAISSDGIRLAGSTVFGDINRRSFSSALALVADLRTSVVFSQLASDETYFTGVAILNPNNAAATVAIELHDPDGRLIDTKSEVIKAGERDARLLTQFFPDPPGNIQSAGYIRLISDRPIASFALYGTQSLSVMSAIPPQ